MITTKEIITLVSYFIDSMIGFIPEKNIEILFCEVQKELRLKNLNVLNHLSLDPAAKDRNPSKVLNGIFYDHNATYDLEKGYYYLKPTFSQEIKIKMENMTLEQWGIIKEAVAASLASFAPLIDKKEGRWKMEEKKPVDVIMAVLYFIWFKKGFINGEGIYPFFLIIRKVLKGLDSKLLDFLATDLENHDLYPDTILIKGYRNHEFSYKLADRSYRIEPEYVGMYKTKFEMLNEYDISSLDLAIDRSWVMVLQNPSLIREGGSKHAF